MVINYRKSIPNAWETIEVKFFLVLLGDLVCNTLLPDARRVGPIANVIKLLMENPSWRQFKLLIKKHYVIDVEDIH